MDVKISFDVLSHKLIDKIKKYPATADILKTNLTDWDPNLIGTSGVILLYYLKDESSYLLPSIEVNFNL